MPRISITIPGYETQPYSIPLDSGVLRIGRSADCELPVDHNSISSYHCEIKRVEGGFVIADAGSTNGIRLNQAPMEVIDLKHGTQVEIGDITLDYELSEEEQEALASEPFKPRQRKKKPKKPTAGATPPVGKTKRARKAAKTKYQNEGAGDFVIFLVFVFVALLAFYFGLSKAHFEATKTEDNPTGRSLMADIKAAQSGEAEEAEESE